MEEPNWNYMLYVIETEKMKYLERLNYTYLWIWDKNQLNRVASDATYIMYV